MSLGEELLNDYAYEISTSPRDDLLWISCKEQLPPLGVLVLTLSKWGHIRDCTLRRYLNGEYYFTPYGLRPGAEITYWMLIPKLPKGDQT